MSITILGRRRITLAPGNVEYTLLSINGTLYENRVAIKQHQIYEPWLVEVPGCEYDNARRMYGVKQ